MSNPRRTRAWWSKTVAEFSVSGLDRQAFARRVGVHPDTLRYWLRELGEAGVRPPSGAAAFVEVELTDAGSAPLPAQAVQVPQASDGARSVAIVVGPAELRFEVGTEPRYLGALVAAVAQAMGRC